MSSLYYIIPMRIKQGDFNLMWGQFSRVNIQNGNKCHTRECYKLILFGRFVHLNVRIIILSTWAI